MLAACASHGNKSRSTANAESAVSCPAEQSARANGEIGLASWYGRDFQGRRTASGEPFDMNALTAAHPTLPIPSDVRLTNLENGRSVVLKVNDRGPRAGGRVIDVSRRAAQLLGFEQAGTARVRVEPLAATEGQVAAAASSSSGCASARPNGAESATR